MKDELIRLLPEPFNFYRLVLDSDHLHFGLWNSEKPDISLEKAQEKMFEMFLDILPEPPAKILDVGCGLGYSAYLLSEKGYEVQAIAPSKELIAYAQHVYSHRNLSFYDNDFFSYADSVLENQCFDVLFLQESLQYLSPLGKVFEKARTLLKDKGIIIISDEVCHDSSIRDKTAVHSYQNIITSLSENGLKLYIQKNIGNEVFKTIESMIQRFEDNRERITQSVSKENTEARLDFFLQGWRLQKEWYEKHTMGYSVLGAKKTNIFIQEYEPGDEEEILNLFKKVFLTDRSKEHWLWKFRDNPYGKFKIAKAVTETGVMAAHYCGYPVIFYSAGEGGGGGTERIAFQVGDTMTNSEFRHLGRGRTSVLSRIASYFYNKFCQNTVPFIYGFNTGNIRKFGERFLEYRYKSEVPYHVLPVSRFKSHFSTLQKLISGFSIERVSGISSEFDLFFEKNVINYKFLIKRDSAYLKWRYLFCPDHSHRIYAVRRFGKLIGWSVFTVKGKKMIWGDAMFDRKFPQGVDFMLSYLLRNEYRELDQIEGWFSLTPEWWVNILERIGFQIKEEPNHLSPGFKFFETDISMDYLEDNYYYTLGDSDLF